MVHFGTSRGDASPAAVPVRRVLLIAPYTPRGGGMGRIMAYLAGCGRQAGVQFETIESRGGGPAVASAWYLAAAACRIMLAAASDPRTIVQLTVGERGSVVRKGGLLLLAHALGLKTILHLHAADIIGFHAGLPRPARRAVAFVFRRADICVVLGEPWRVWLTRELGIAPARITVIRNGVPQPEVATAATRRGVFTVVFLGNLLARKGIADLLHALATLSAPGLPPWQLVIAGSGADGDLKRLARDLGVASNVRFAGWLDRAATQDLLRGADVLALPSYHEALPLVLLEAASLGVPVITTPVGAIAEVFTHEHDALMVVPGDRAALADALARLAGDPALARRLGENGRRLYQRRFTMDAFVGGLAALYARLDGAAPC
jgi:glycosyltransferase involved in cell wall biosynthesis